MVFRWRKLIADGILACMVVSAGYVNLVVKSSNTSSIHGRNVVYDLILLGNIRNVLHIVGFATIGFLVGPRRILNDKGSSQLALKYAIWGGLLIEITQVITNHSRIDIGMMKEGLQDIGLDIIGVTVSLLILRKKTKRSAEKASLIFSDKIK